MLLTHLRECRESKGYSIRDLTALTGINPSNISRLENLRVEPHPKTVRILAEALEVKVEELYKNKEHEVQKPTSSIQFCLSKPAKPISYWVFEQNHEEEPFRFDTEAEAQRLKKRLHKKARIYEATNLFMAKYQHLQFLRRLARREESR